MRKSSRGYVAGAALAALALLAAACSSGGSTSSTSTPSGPTVAGWQGVNPGGTPKSGGTLNMLGQGDVDYMDYNISYYTIGSLAQRLWVRGLYAYPAIPGAASTRPYPDLATAPPVISNGGKTFTVTIRTGAMWDTSPPRQVTAADALRGLERSCNPVQPFGGLPDFETLIVGYQDFCTKFAKLGASATPAPDEELPRQQLALRRDGLRADHHLQPGPPGVVLRDHADAGPVQPGPGGKPELRPGERRGAAARHRRRALQDPELHAGQDDRVRAQPGLEGQQRPDPQGVRGQDRGVRDRERAERPAAAADQHRGRVDGVRRVPAGGGDCPGS